MKVAVDSTKVAPSLPVGISEEKASPAPSASVEASAALCEHVQRQGLHSHLFSDITLSFCGKDHQLHRIILSQSSYFHSLLSGPWKENGKSRIELQIDDPNVTPEGLEISLSYMYGVTPVFTGDNVISVLAVGCFLCLENLCEKSVQFIVEDLKVETFVAYQQLSERHCYGRFADSIRNACWTFLCTHASTELVHILPKFSLQVLCLLLRSDELWVMSESDRYKLSKRALIDWKLARAKAPNDSSDSSSQRKSRIKPFPFKKKGKSASSTALRSKSNFQKASRMSAKQKGGKKKELAVAVAEEAEPVSEPKEEIEETDFKKLLRLWEADDPLYKSKEESFKAVAELFTGGGIIFAHMEADEVLKARKELEDAGLPTDAANDSIWQHVLLKFHLSKFLGSTTSHSYNSSSDESDDDSSSDDEDGDDDYNEAFMDKEKQDCAESTSVPSSGFSTFTQGDEDEDSSDVDSSDSDAWNTEPDSESNSSDVGRDGVAGSCQASKRLKTQSTSIVCFGCADSIGLSETLAGGDGKRRRTTGGFTWAAKPDIGMQLSDFPPFRFGVEFILLDEKRLIQRSPDHFYGGSLWRIVGHDEKEDWVFGVQCQRPLDNWEIYSYRDNRKRVPFMAKLYVKTCQGLRCVTGTAVRGGHHNVSIHLSRKDLGGNEHLRMSAVVQLIDDVRMK